MLSFKKSTNIDINLNLIAENIIKIKNGDSVLRESFISDYKPFILKTASKFTKKYIEIENSEEFSIALMAFNQAIDDYDEEKNHHFLSFAELVIKRRLINYTKKETKFREIYPFSFFEYNKVNTLENTIAEKSIHLHFENFETREEILIYTEKLKKFGISFNDLIAKTPKHMDSKQQMLNVSRIIAENDYLYQKLDKKLQIPMTDLMPLIGINSKTVERNRKYIIAACIAMRSDLEIIKGFLQAFMFRG